MDSLLSAYLYVAKLSTDAAGQPIINKFLAAFAKIAIALDDQDLHAYAELLPQIISLSKTWLPHVRNRPIQEAAVKTIQILQRLQNKVNNGELRLSDIYYAFKEAGVIYEKCLKQLTLCCKC